MPDLTHPEKAEPRMTLTESVTHRIMDRELGENLMSDAELNRHCRQAVEQQLRVDPKIFHILAACLVGLGCWGLVAWAIFYAVWRVFHGR